MFMTFIAITGFAFSAVSVFWTASDRYPKWRGYLSFSGAVMLALVVGTLLGILIEGKIQLDVALQPRTAIGLLIVVLSILLAVASYTRSFFVPLGPERAELSRGGYCFGALVFVCVVFGGNFFFPEEVGPSPGTFLLLDDAETIALADFNAQRGDTERRLVILSTRARVLRENDPRRLALMDQVDQVHQEVAETYNSPIFEASPETVPEELPFAAAE